MFSLRFDRKDLPHWADCYPVEEDKEIEIVIAPQVRARGYYTKNEFQKTCNWKTHRSEPLVEKNPEGFIHAATQTALSTPDERLRIEVLTLLDGVGWPTASVLLHFGHSVPYPILDFRALWSLEIDKPPIDYDFNFWWEYTQFCRHLASEAGVTMRNLDRALWQYSKENQKVTG